MILTDVPLVGRVQTRGTRVGRPSRQEACVQESCLVLRGMPDERYYAEFKMAARPAMNARRLLFHAIALRDCSEHVCVSVATLGMAMDLVGFLLALGGLGFAVVQSRLAVSMSSVFCEHKIQEYGDSLMRVLFSVVFNCFDQAVAASRVQRTLPRLHGSTIVPPPH